MAHPILMPMPGQMTEECTIVAWRKRQGDPVARGDVLFEIETDKSNMDVEAFDAGILLRILVGEGETVPVNTVCAWVGEAGEAIPEAVGVEPKATAEPMPTAGLMPAEPMPAAGPMPAAAPAPTAVPAPTGRGRAGGPISPRAARLAGELGLDPASIVGSGPNGRIVERDVQAAARRGAATPPMTLPSSPEIEPDALELAARELVVSLGVRGSGPGGRIARADVERALRERPRPLSRMRQVIAQRLTESFTTTPHFAVTVAVDMTALGAFREELKAGCAAYSVTDFISFAVVRSLVEFPAVNGRTDGRSVWLRERVDLGLAVALEAGLVVPVVRGAERMGLAELHERSAAVIAGARAGTLLPDDLSGSTFTISNMGMLGVEHFTAIINPGEAAILAVSSTVPTPVVVGEGIGIRQVMRMTLSADHRLVDGALAAAFLGAVRGRLEDVATLRAAATP